MDSLHSLDFLCFCLGQGGVGGGLERYLLYCNHLKEGQQCQVPIVLLFYLDAG